ncbi:ribosome assembly RNA-binding protein YhbY [Lapidilactobacillus salsurivasis]
MLTSKQKRYIKSQANRLKPLVHVGKNGVNEAFLTDLRRAFATRELIKVNLLQNAPVTTEAVVTAVSEISDVTVVQVLGRVLTIYRPSHKEKYQQLSTEVNAIK